MCVRVSFVQSAVRSGKDVNMRSVRLANLKYRKDIVWVTSYEVRRRYRLAYVCACA